jgi:hypothetical protein
MPGGTVNPLLPKNCAWSIASRQLLLVNCFQAIAPKQLLLGN